LWRHCKKSFIRSRNFYRDTWPGLYERRGWKAALRKLNQPSLILWGIRDRINPLDSGLELMKELPEAYFFQHDSAGHWVGREDPEWVSARMREFLFKTEARGPQVKNAG
jgi:pimeloyl-ACP methyl ester carboxylesterase